MKKLINDIFEILDIAERRKLWLLTVSDIIISLLDIGFLFLMLLIINFYTRTTMNAGSGILSPDLFKEHPLLPITVFFLLFAVKNTFGFILSGSQYRFVYGVASRISRDRLLQFLQGNYPDFVHIDSAVMNRKISQQPIEFAHYVLNGMQKLFSQLVLISITCLALLLFNPLLFPILILFLAPPAILISYIMKRKLNTSLRNGKTEGEKSIQHLQEALTGYVESNIYLKNDFFTWRYYRFQAQLNRYLSERLAIQSMPGRLMEVFAVFGLLVLILASNMGGHEPGLRLLTIGSIMIGVYKIIPGIVQITNLRSQIQTYSYSTVDLSTESSVIPERRNPDFSIDTLQFENIFFSYADKLILRDFSLEMGKGDFIGISGISGRGKSTMIHLLLGFLTQDSGAIRINKRFTQSESRKAYWSRISYSKQQPFFLHATLLENITLEEKDQDQEKLERVLRITGIDKIIHHFPHGINTIISENGKNFSGGQRQRFILARALYKDADLIILDEPFSELDESAEKEMLIQLQSIAAAGKIVLLITHHTEALHYCNKKLLMDE